MTAPHIVNTYSHKHTHTQTDISLFCYVLLLCITQPHSVCFRSSFQLKRSVMWKYTEISITHSAKQRKVEIITFTQTDPPCATHIMICFQLSGTSHLTLGLSTTDSYPSWLLPERRASSLDYTSLLFLNSAFGLTSVYLYRSQLYLSNEHKCRDKDRRHLRLSVPVIFPKTMCQVLRDVHY